VVFGLHRGEAGVRGTRASLWTKPGKFRHEIERQVRYANIAIIEGIGASQHGIGMACARIAEIFLRNEPAVIPIGSYNAAYGVTLSLPSVLGGSGVLRILKPPISMTSVRRCTTALMRLNRHWQGYNSVCPEQDCRRYR